MPREPRIGDEAPFTMPVRISECGDFLRGVKINASAHLRRLAPALAALLLLRPGALAQLPMPAGANLFGDDLVRNISKIDDEPFGTIPAPSEDELKRAREAAKGYKQVLIFQNDRQLRGELVSLDDEGIVWRRPDADVPIRFSRSDVQRIVPSPAAASPAAVKSEFPSSGPVRATVKLAGADWLYGDLTSDDAQTFVLRTDGLRSFTIPRAAIEWLYFDTHPAPACAFTGNMSDFEGWLGLLNHQETRMEGKAIVFEDGFAFGSMPRTKRLEIILNLPADCQENARLQLFPSEHMQGVDSGEFR